MKRIMKPAIAAAILMASNATFSTTLTSFDYQWAGGQSGPEFNYFDFEILDENRSTKLFDTLVFGVEHIGQSFTITSLSDPAFNYFADLFTNGIEDNIWLQHLFSTTVAGGGSGAGSRFSEGALFFGSDGLGDLAGSALESITLTLNSVAFSQAHVTPSGSIVNFWGEADITISMNGTSTAVPEPGIRALLFLGFVGFLATAWPKSGRRH